MLGNGYVWGGYVKVVSMSRWWACQEGLGMSRGWVPTSSGTDTWWRPPHIWSASGGRHPTGMLSCWSSQ